LPALHPALGNPSTLISKIGVVGVILHASILLFQRRRFNTAREVFARAKCGRRATEIGRGEKRNSIRL
jgi:hypothetical protein